MLIKKGRVISSHKVVPHSPFSQPSSLFLRYHLLHFSSSYLSARQRERLLSFLPFYVLIYIYIYIHTHINTHTLQHHHLLHPGHQIRKCKLINPGNHYKNLKPGAEIRVMATTSISNSEANSNRSLESKRKKTRKIGIENQLEEAKLRWKSEAEQQIYSSKLIQALRQVGQNTFSPETASAVGVRDIRDTADRVLAVTAKGRTRWSRAILTTPLRLKLSKINNQHKKQKKVKVTGNIRSKKPVAKKRMPALQPKVRVLGRLIPGCRKLSFPNLLEETTDYIAALEMQVRTLSALTGLLTGAAPLAASDRLGWNLS
ncbi:hypothetical protein F0562_020048 [Nyssa sinensis]|uniref:BHLH domain-containing protein n=1 Tax=Nyssa sinensis TaxID=561372 RepID=A0A5J5BRE3_9ASTE|nr:hypothetical protein F0562_020048 [Nyssa sinensis]